MVVIVVPLTNSVLTIDPSAIEIVNKIVYSVNIRSLMLQTLPRYTNIGWGIKQMADVFCTKDFRISSSALYSSCSPKSLYLLPDRLESSDSSTLYVVL